MSSRARVIVLVGPKGAGKTTVGRMLERVPGVFFLEVERIAKRVLAETGGVIDDDYARRTFAEVVAEVERLSVAHRVVVLETTGASSETPRLLDDLRRHHRVALVRIRVSEQECARRISGRDPSRQVQVPAEMIRQMHERTEALRLPWELEVDNEVPLAEDELLRRFGPLLHDDGRDGA